MKSRLLIIGGFALGCQPLQPLATKLAPLVSDCRCFDPLLESGVEDFLQTLANSLSAKTILLGWSLGGQLASLLAQRQPKKIAALITIASNPCFVRREDWPGGMDPLVFAQFSSLFSRQPQQALQRFAYLVSQGESQQKSILAALKSHLPGIDVAAQLAGLTALRQLDTRAALAEMAAIELPQLHLLAANDALVAAEISDSLDAMQQSSTRLIANSGHIVPFSQTDKVFEILTTQLPQLWQ